MARVGSKWLMYVGIYVQDMKITEGVRADRLKLM